MNGEVRGQLAHEEKPAGHRAGTLLLASNHGTIMNQFAVAHKIAAHLSAIKSPAVKREQVKRLLAALLLVLRGR